MFCDERRQAVNAGRHVASGRAGPDIAGREHSDPQQLDAVGVPGDGGGARQRQQCGQRYSQLPAAEPPGGH